MDIIIKKIYFPSSYYSANNNLEEDDGKSVLAQLLLGTVIINIINTLLDALKILKKNIFTHKVNYGERKIY